MKKNGKQPKVQRTNNPRFLGALGFLGFLGFLGSRNPEVVQWSKLAWLSLFSLLVLFPTMDIDNPKASYRLNPKRKWALVFLGFLGFLGFLAGNISMLSGFACLAMLSQLALSKVEMSAEKRRKVRKQGVIFGIFFGVFFVVFVIATPLFHPMAGLLIPLLVLPTLLPFTSIMTGEDRFPIRDLLPIFLLLFAAVIVPTGGVIWFMTQAMRNERMAVRQRLSEVYKSQLDAAEKQINSTFIQWREQLGRHKELNPPQRFDALVRESFADSILLLDEQGQLVYPTQPDIRFEKSSEQAVLLQSEIHRLLKARSLAEARKAILQMDADDSLKEMRDSGGRLILPALKLFYLQSIIEMDVGMLVSLREMVTDYHLEIIPARRLFFMQVLAGWGMDVEPWFSAELLLADLSEEMESVKPGGLALQFVPKENIYLLYSEDRRSIAAFKSEKLFVSLRELAASSSSVEGVDIRLQMKQERGAEQPMFSTVVQELGQNWVLDLYVDSDDPFVSHADQRILTYFWTGFAVVGLMSVACGLLMRSLLAQQRLTRMKNDFVATVTHELKTPLASTRMLVDTLLQGRCRDDQQRHEYLELIARENKRLSRLIENFLTFSRMERDKRKFNFEKVAPGDIADVAIDAVRENFERCGCILTLDIAEDLPSIVADQDAIVTVLLNLLDNACKYSEDDKRIALTVFSQNDTVCFQVKDSGIGMNRREQSKIFDRFYQVDQSLTRQVSGAGLGLSIVSFIVNAHNGSIDVESESGKGSVFTVKIKPSGEG